MRDKPTPAHGPMLKINENKSKNGQAKNNNNNNRGMWMSSDEAKFTFFYLF